MIVSRIFFTLIMSIFISFSTSQVAAEKIVVSGFSGAGFGRLVFNWRSPVGFDVQKSGNVARIRFSERIEANINLENLNLSNFLTDLSVDLDGKAILLRLAKNAEIKSYYSGTSVIVEFLPDEKNIEEKSSILPLVRVRGGIHAGYSRIVFDWSTKVNYEIQPGSNNVQILFAKPANIGVDKVATQPLKFIGRLETRVAGDQSIVNISIKKAADIKHFRLGNKIVVDIGKPSKLSMASASSVASQSSVKNAKKSKVASPGPQVLIPQNKTIASNSGLKSSSKAFPPSISGKNEKVTGNISGAMRATPGGGKIYTLTFSGAKPISSVVFRRGNYLWLVFDAKAKLNSSVLVASSQNIIQEIEEIPSSRGMVLRLRTQPNNNPKLRSVKNTVTLDFSPSELLADVSLKVMAVSSKRKGAKVLIPLTNPSKPIVFTDPLIGDNLIAVPILPINNGISNVFSYPQFDVLASGHGVVIAPRIDTLRIRSRRNGVVIDSPNYLAISGGTDLTRPKRKKKKEVSRIIPDLNDFIVTDIAKLVPIRNKLKRTAAESVGPEREIARLNLAKFFLANGFSAEIFGVVGAVVGDRPQASKEPLIRMLHGAANFGLGRYSEASVDFNDPSLKGNDEADLWRTATEAKLGNLKSARNLIRGEGVIKKYPRRLTLDLGLIIAETAVQIGKSKPAMRALKTVNKIEPDKNESARIKYVEGRLKELKKDFVGAVKDWEAAIASKHLPSQVRARVARTELLLKQKKMDRREAIKEYENLRYSWRGDDFEFETLTRLGNLYISEHFYREGLEALKEAATYFRYNPKAPAAAQLMSSTYNKLFLKGLADNIDAIKAVAIFEEFNELMPAGRNGDEMIRYLADRLVEVDLLERAGDLLEEQVNERLEGEEKSRVGARLALIRMLARQYEMALKTLDNTETKTQIKNLNVQRRQLRARILFSQQDELKALDLLEEDESESADLLRYEIYWKLQQWAKVVDVMRRLFKASDPKPRKPLNDKQASRLLNFVIALALSGGDRTIMRIRKDYGSVMENHKLGEAFKLVTEPKTPGFLNPNLVSAKVLKAETFLSDYRDRLKEGLPLSAIN